MLQGDYRSSSEANQVKQIQTFLFGPAYGNDNVVVFVLFSVNYTFNVFILIIKIGFVSGYHRFAISLRA